MEPERTHKQEKSGESSSLFSCFSRRKYYCFNPCDTGLAGATLRKASITQDILASLKMLFFQPLPGGIATGTALDSIQSRRQSNCIINSKISQVKLRSF
nr:MAG TPA: hypothetical protein [Caudoviricetes sp.]